MKMDELLFLTVNPFILKRKLMTMSLENGVLLLQL